MKKILLIALGAAFALMLTSCGEKCTTCRYTYQVAGVTETGELGEACGNKAAIDLFKEAAQSSAEAIAPSDATNIVATCIDD